MTDDPREILKAAGVECADVDEYESHRYDLPAGEWAVRESSDLAIFALARLVAKYKAMAEDIACGYDHNRANMDVARNSDPRVARLMSEAASRWDEHNA